MSIPLTTNKFKGTSRHNRSEYRCLSNKQVLMCFEVSRPTA